MRQFYSFLYLNQFQFQSTHLREVRHCCHGSSLPYMLFQSTHLREVRLASLLNQVDWTNFNPRTYVRCDNPSSITSSNSVIFQSTHLREVRRHTCHTQQWVLWFQSTHLREVRRTPSYHQAVRYLFQSTHLREVRPSHTWNIILYITISIHAPTWGATLAKLATNRLSGPFQSTHLREVRRN